MCAERLYGCGLFPRWLPLFSQTPCPPGSPLLMERTCLHDFTPFSACVLGDLIRSPVLENVCLSSLGPFLNSRGACVPGAYSVPAWILTRSVGLVQTLGRPGAPLPALCHHTHHPQHRQLLSSSGLAKTLEAP